MHILSYNQQVPVYSLEPDEVTGNKYFRVYNYEGSLPGQSDLLVPHRKEWRIFLTSLKSKLKRLHYLFVPDQYLNFTNIGLKLATDKAVFSLKFVLSN